MPVTRTRWSCMEPTSRASSISVETRLFRLSSGASNGLHEDSAHEPIDEACRIDDVSGPPPDGLLSAVHFDHGVEGVNELVAYHRSRGERLPTFVGMWHNHPWGEAKPARPTNTGCEVWQPPLANSRAEP